MEQQITRMNPDEAAKFLLDSGLLFEINWKILHPFGLALAVKEDESGAIAFAGINKTSDLTGWEFDDIDFVGALHKLKRFVWSKESRERLSARKLSLGCTVQNESDRDTHTAPVQKGLI